MTKTRIAILFSLLFTLGGAQNLFAEKLAAKPLEGAGDYEFLFFPADRGVEIGVYLSRVREIDTEAAERVIELRKVEADLKSVEGGGAGKRGKTLEWSPIENISGYSVKIYNGQKELLETHKTTENTITLDLEEGSYYFQVAATTKLKAGTYSRMSGFRVTRGKHSPAALKLEDQVEILREKERIAQKLRLDYLAAIRQKANDTKSSGEPVLDSATSTDAVYFLALEKKSSPQKISDMHVIPGKDTKVIAPSTAAAGSFFWGAGAVAGIQDTRLDYFRMSFGAEGFLRQDKAYFGFLRPQLKLQVAYSGSKSSVYDALLYANLYPGIYYPLQIGRGFSFVGSLSTGPNLFLVFATAGSSSVLQWGVMPAVEVQYAITDRLAIYLGGGINFTFDSSGVLKFVPINLGVTGRF